MPTLHSTNRNSSSKSSTLKLTKSRAPRSNKLSINLPVLAIVLLIPICISIASPNKALADSSPQEQIQSWTNEIARLIDKQAYAEAALLARQALDLNQRQSGKEDKSNCKYLNNLGWLLQQNGEYVEARKAFEEAKSLSESHNLEDGEYAWTLNNLATLLYLQGDFESSSPFYERALAIYEKLADSQKTVRTLRNLAGVLDALDKGNEALSAYKKAIEIVEKEATVDQLELAQCLEAMASSLEDKEKYDECLPLFQRSLSIKEKLLGTEHIELVSLLNNLAVLNIDTGHNTDAKPLLERALAITEKAEGTAHVDLVVLLNNLGDLAILEKNPAGAERHYLRAAAIVNAYLSELLPYCSVAEQYAMYKAYSREQVSRLLSVCTEPAKISEAYKIFFAWKGTLLASLARQSEARRNATSPELKADLEQLSRLRAGLAAWYQEAGSVLLKEWKQRNQLLTQEKERLERKIISADPSFSSQDNQLSLETFQSQLKANEALIDIFQYEHISPGAKGLSRELRYAAVVTCAAETQKQETFVDLGDAKILQFRLKQWRDEVAAAQTAEIPWKQIQELLRKPFSSLPAATTNVWVCPDAELARLPWHLIGTGKNLLLCQIDSPRELAKLRTSAVKPAQTQTMLLVGDVDFSSGVDKSAKPSMVHFPQLQGTSAEAKSIGTLARAEHLALIELSGQAANKTELLKFLPQASYVHLATHGFFFNESFVDAARFYHQNTRSVQLRPRLDANLTRRNPLVESGIALAGANKVNADKTLEKGGILTAEEFIDADLSNCKLAVLSACDTGRGEELTGQGVMGLRASILAAGARNLLISLWRVPDIATAEIMKEFYSNLWVKKMGAAAALKQAQTDMLKKFPANTKQPINWAAWILVGEGW